MNSLWLVKFPVVQYLPAVRISIKYFPLTFKHDSWNSELALHRVIRLIPRWWLFRIQLFRWQEVTRSDEGSEKRIWCRKESASEGKGERKSERDFIVEKRSKNLGCSALRIRCRRRAKRERSVYTHTDQCRRVNRQRVAVWYLGLRVETNNIIGSTRGIIEGSLHVNRQFHRATIVGFTPVDRPLRNDLPPYKKDLPLLFVHSRKCFPKS